MITGSKHDLASALKGFRSLSHHSYSFISSLASTSFGSASNHHLVSAISRFNALVSPSEVITVKSSPLSQYALSKKLDDHLFQSMLMTSSRRKKARLLSASAPHASSWLSVVPAVGLDLVPAEFQAATKSDSSGGWV